METLHARRRDLRLDGIRGVAVLLVLLYHVQTSTRFMRFDSRLLPGGWLGVPVFFVLSGYLITRLLLEERQAAGTVDRRAFYRRRVRRLVPALAVLLAVWLLATLSGLVPVQMLGSTAPSLPSGLALVPLVGVALLAYNWLLAFDLPSPVGMGHLWTLSVEEQFYLALPTVIVLLGARSRRPERLLWRLLLAGVAASLVLTALATAYGRRDVVYFSTPTAGLGLLLGALVAVRPPRVRRPDLGVAGLGAILALSLSVRDSRPVPVALAVVAVSLAAAALVAHGGAERLLEARWLRWSGRRSYAIYLWSSPVGYLVLRDLGRTWAAAAVLVAASLVLAELSWRLVERRFLYAARGTGSRREKTATAYGAPAAAATIVSSTNATS